MAVCLNFDSRFHIKNETKFITKAAIRMVTCTYFDVSIHRCLATDSNLIERPSDGNRYVVIASLRYVGCVYSYQVSLRHSYYIAYIRFYAWAMAWAAHCIIMCSKSYSILSCPIYSYDEMNYIHTYIHT